MPTLPRPASLLLATAITAALAACSTTIEQPQRLAALAAPPERLQFVWAAPKPPVFSALPAVGVAIVGTPVSTFFASYPVESIALADALAEQLQAMPALHGKLAFTGLPAPGSPAQLQAALKAADRASAVVVLTPERVTSHCLPGCYAFKIRVNYLAPRTHAKLWTGLVDAPPKAKHSDRFDGIAAEVARLLVQQLAAEQLLPS